MKPTMQMKDGDGKRLEQAADVMREQANQWGTWPMPLDRDFFV